MSAINPLNLLITSAGLLLLLGIGTFICGIVVLVYRVAGRHLRTLATQTTNLAQKGITEEVAGLVGNAASLLDSINQLLRTTAGVGVFLSFLGLLMIAAGCWLAIQLYPVWP